MHSGHTSALTLFALLGLGSTAIAQTIDLQQLSTPFATPIGIDYHEPTDSLILSANYSGGFPHNLERILFDGTHVQFSALAGATNELKIATVRSSGNPGGFVVGDLFTGNGVDGQIIRITDNGATIINPWVDLPGGGNGLMRGSLYIDRTGVFGGDLIVCTTAGEVWRINAGGIPTFLTDLNVHLEGLITVPDDPARFGPIAGTILCGAEGQTLTHSIDTSGAVTSYNFGVRVEDIDLIEPSQSFFGVNFGSNRLLAASASGFAAIAGDILLTQETHSGVGLYHLDWDGANYTAVQLTLAAGSQVPSQWEHVTFAPVGIVPFPDCDVFPSASLSTLAGVPLSFTVTGEDDSPTETVTLSAVGLPGNAVATPPLPASGTPMVSVTIDWTPTGSQVGTHEIVFIASDSSGLETECLVTITVGAAPCVTLDFDTEDDFITALVNGQHIDTEFGTLVTLSSSGPNAGMGIFDSTPSGPNDPSQDVDLLVDTGNLLILQTENFPADAQDVFPRPNDDEDGGTITFTFGSGVEARSVRLVDLDSSDGTSLVVLVDGDGRERVYTVPSNWTGDLGMSQPGQGSLDLMTLAPQPGFGSVATATEDALFDSSGVVRIDIELASSGAIDDLSWCAPATSLAHARAVPRNGSGLNPEILDSLTLPVLGGSWVTELDCSAHAPGQGFLFVYSSATSGAELAFGELLVTGNRRYLVSRPHFGGLLTFSAELPRDMALCGLEGSTQGLCMGAPGPRLSNAVDIVLGF